METEVSTHVVPENGQWTVYLVVVTPDGVQRRPVQTHRSQARARLAADVLRRTAARRRSPREETDA